MKKKLYVLIALTGLAGMAFSQIVVVSGTNANERRLHKQKLGS